MRRSISMTAAAALVFSASVLLACSVPVFRYALEQWRPDAFRVVVFHRGELSADEKALVERIEPTSLDAAYVGNVWVKTIDLDKEPEAEFVELWKQQETETLPWMLAQSPQKFGRTMKVVATGFTSENVDRLLDSPKRKQLGERLIKGESVVWILLESGNKETDDAAAKVMTDELERLKGELKLPEIDQKDIDDGFLSVNPDELKIRFSMLRVSRTDPEEAAFVSMLLNTEPDLHDPEFDGQPMALPVFGRGRSLYALIGKGINAETIEDASRFLTGACQCTVKAQNPGVDLLTTIDWDAVIVPQLEQDSAAPTLTGLGQFLESPKARQIEAKLGIEPFGGDTEMVESNDVTPAEGESPTQPSEKVVTLRSKPRSLNVSVIAFAVFGAIAILVAGLSLMVGRKVC